MKQGKAGLTTAVIRSLLRGWSYGSCRRWRAPPAR